MAGLATAKVPITNNPYQGLKPIIIPVGGIEWPVPITNNPYQGLKPERVNQQ